MARVHFKLNRICGASPTNDAAYRESRQARRNMMERAHRAFREETIGTGVMDLEFIYKLHKQNQPRMRTIQVWGRTVQVTEEEYQAYCTTF